MRHVRRAIGTAGVLTALLLAVPASAQSALNGDWVGLFHEDQPERGPGPELGDYLGLPLNAAARQYAESWDASRLTLPEHQCRAHVSPYIYRGPVRVRISEERDPQTQAVIAIKHFISTYAQERTIWLDGRPHPSDYAPHTWMGFSTGRWDGDMLIVETTHLKQGWVRRNGLPMSDRATYTEYIVLNGEMMSHIGVLVDPVFLTEPLVKSEELMRAQRDLPAQTWLWVCEPVVEIATQVEGDVPAYLPGEHPFRGEFETRHHLPEFAAQGGSETMFPEFQARLREWLAKNPRPAAGAKK